MGGGALYVHLVQREGGGGAERDVEGGERKKVESRGKKIRKEGEKKEGGVKEDAQVFGHVGLSSQYRRPV